MMQRMQSLVRRRHRRSRKGWKRAGTAGLLLLLLLQSALLTPPQVAEAAQEGPFTYYVNGATARIAAYNGTDTDIVIPERVGASDEYEVTEISSLAFYSKSLTSVVLPDSLIVIGSGAFQANALTSITIPDSVTTIGASAFMANQLTSFDWPDGVTSMANGVFQSNRLTSVTIPDQVTSVGNNTFASNFNLASVTLPDNLQTIGNSAFAWAQQLTSLVIPDQVTSIGNYAFSYANLSSLSLPDGLTTIGNGAFSYNQLTGVDLPDSVTAIGTDAFRNNQLTGIVLPNGVTTVSPGAFQFNQLASVVLPDGLTSIGAEAFQSNWITSLELPEGLESIGADAFLNNRLPSLVFPRSVTSLADTAFGGYYLAEVTFLNPSTTIGANQFYGQSDDLTLIGYPGSTAESYAAANDHSFQRYGQPLLDGLDLAADLLDAHPAGTAAGEVPQTARDTLVAALPAAQSVADELENVDPQPLADATDALLAAIAAFEAEIVPLSIAVPADGTYGRDDVLAFTISYADEVTVTGDPVIALEIGNAGSTQTVEADYTGARGTALQSLTFEYEVAAGLLDEDGIGVDNAITLPGGATIKAADSSPAPLAYTVPSTTGIQVDSGPTDAEAVADDKAALAITYAPGDSAASVTQDVGLPTGGSSGTTITWSSSDDAVVDTDGTVTRPAYTASAATVTLTATIAKGAESDTEVFTLTVIPQAQTDAEAVADDKAALAITYAPGDSASSVTQDVGLPTSGSSGTTITWTSSDDAVVDVDGTVTRPAYTESNAAVTLTATISKGGESDTQTSALTVIRQAQTDAEAVADDKAALAITYAPGDSAASVTQDVGLPTGGSSGTTITWSSSDTAVIDVDGTVTRPAYTESDASVTLMATISKNGESDTQTFALTVIPQAQTDAEAVADDKAALAITYAPGDSASSVTQDVGLPTGGSSGTTITWSSSEDGVIDTDGTVVRPAYTDSDAAVTLTATISKGGESDTQTFALTVIRQAQTDAEAVADDKAALAITYAPGDSAASVTQDVGLP
ncbi:leucine-rich repeat protein, partial [Paenibacillus sp. IB182496]